MDYRQGEDERGDWYNNSVDSDAQFAAQLQRQFDDEDVLTAQLESTFNFGQRPGLAHSVNPESSNNLKNDEEFARRLQRKFFLDLKNQGFAEIDIASMLDSLSPDHQRQTDTDFEMAIRASLGDEMADQPATNQSFLEKFLLTLYSNCRHESDATVAPPPTDDFSVFREQASKSIKTMTDEMLISAEKVVDIMLDKVLNNSQEWNEVEAALFVINSISGQMNTSDLNTQKTRLLQHIILLPTNSNPLLINTSASLIGNLSHWLYLNKTVAVSCVHWVLSLPPYESLLLSISQVLEKMASVMHSELADSFKPIFDFLPYIELTTDRGAEMESAALNLLRACTHLLNDRPSDQLIDGLKALTDRPIYALNELAGGNHRLDEAVANNSWHVLAVNPGLWLQRIYQIFKTLHAWDSQSEYLSLKFAGEYPIAPWAPLSHDVCEVICRIISAYSNDKTVVDNCCTCVLQTVNSDLSNSSTLLISRLLEELLALYNRQPQSYILQLAGAVIDEFTSGLGAEETIANFLNAVCIQTDSGIEMRESPDIIQSLFSIVNAFTRLRIAAFVEKPAAQLMFEMAIAGLSVEQNDIHKYARTFIFMFLQFSRNLTSPQLSSVLQNIELIMSSCFEKLIDACFRIALFETSIPLLGTVAEVLAELLLVENQRMDDYLDQTIRHLTAPHAVSEDEINNFEIQLRHCLNAEDVLNSIICFSKTIHN